MATVATGARLHFGFQNLALAHDRLYGGVGAALSEPRIVVEAERAPSVRVEDPDAAEFVPDVADLLGVEGARVTVSERYPRHAGLGSGTQLALACLEQSLARTAAKSTPASVPRTWGGAGAAASASRPSRPAAS